MILKKTIFLFTLICLLGCKKEEPSSGDSCADRWISNTIDAIAAENIKVNNGNLILKSPATANNTYITSRFNYSPYAGGNTCSYKWNIYFSSFDFPDNQARLILKFRSSTVDVGTVYICNDSIYTTDFNGVDFSYNLNAAPGPLRVELETRSDFRAELRVYLPHDTLLATKNLFNGGGIYTDLTVVKPQTGTSTVVIDNVNVYQCNINQTILTEEFECLSFYQ